MNRGWGNPRNKFQAVKSYSELCGRKFDSKAERRRGEELFMLQKAGAISDLEFQKDFRLCDRDPGLNQPKIGIKIDFVYRETSSGRIVHEDVKGIETREFRVKRAWFQEKYTTTIFLTS